MKKFHIWLLTVLLLAAMVLGASAEGAVPHMSLSGGGSVVPGGTVTVTVFLSNSDQLITSGGASLGFDGSVLEIVSSSALVGGGSVSGGSGSFALGGASVLSGSLFSVQLRVKDTAPLGSYFVSVSPWLSGPEGSVSCTASGTSVTVVCNHSYGEWSNAEEAGHKRTCSKCGAEDTAAHTWDEGSVTLEPTCKDEGTRHHVCTACGAQKDAVIEKLTTHSWNSGTLTVQPTCKDEGTMSYTCTVCGTGKTEPVSKLTTHTYGSSTRVDAQNHTHTCTVCGHEETAPHAWVPGTVIKQPTCKEDGSREYNCSDCGDSRQETLPKTNFHIFGGWAKADDANHRRTCTVCSEAFETAAHIWNSGVVTREPTCGAAGEKLYTCTLCPATRKEEIPATQNHTYGSWILVDQTNHTHTCTVCGKGENAAHSWNSGTVTKAPTCTAEGEKTFTCTACSASKTERMEKAAHTFGAWTKVDNENHRHSCTVCGERETTAHEWNDTVEKEATCKEEGVRNFACALCSAEKKETIPVKTEHTFGAWEKVDDEQHIHTCLVCTITRKEDHNWNDGVETKKPTCKDEGEKTYICLFCGGIKKEKIEKLTEHTYEAACSEECTVCGEKRTVTNHKYSTNWSSDGDEHYHECTVCGQKKDVEKHKPGSAATELKPQVCRVCNRILHAALAHTHEYSEAYSRNVDGHWHNCYGCDLKKDEAPHSFDNDCDTTCSVCGYKRKIKHEYGDEWLKDNAQHWRECAVCGEKSGMEPHVPGQQATEDTDQLCTVCGYVLQKALGHRHVYSEVWVRNASTHWHECSCGAVDYEATHVWTENGKCAVCLMEDPSRPQKGSRTGTAAAIAAVFGLGIGVAAGGGWYLMGKRRKAE